MSLDRDRLLDFLDRAHVGPVCKEYDWNMSVLPQTIEKALARYGLHKTCDPSHPVNQDDDLADRYFQAGLDTAAETGLLCSDTHRVIRYTREEILDAVERAPAQFYLGEGAQRVCFKSRGVEDPTPPVWVAPLSIVVTEDIFVTMVEGIARVSEVDVMQGPSLETVSGRVLRSGSPYESLAGHYQAHLMEEGQRRAGRAGMGMGAIASSTTQYGLLSGFGLLDGYRPDRDMVVALCPSDLHVNYEAMFKLAHAYNAGAQCVHTASNCQIGGFTRGAEGTTVGCIAGTLLLFTAFQAANGGCYPFDLQYMGNCGRKAQWSLSMVFQAVKRNTHLVLNSILNQVSGPCTKMLLYESLVGMTNLAVSGASSCTGVRSAGGRRTNYLTPLEIKFAGQVFKAAAGMTREQADELANHFLPKYEAMLRTPPDGKSFKECYDVEKLQPTDEWQSMYDEVAAEAIQAGLSLA